MLPISNCGVIFYDIISLRAEAAAMICRFSQARAQTMKHDFYGVGVGVVGTDV